MGAPDEHEYDRHDSYRFPFHESHDCHKPWPREQKEPAAQRPQLPPATQDVHAADVAPREEKLPAAQGSGSAEPPAQPVPP